MDPNQLSPGDLAQLQTLLDRMQRQPQPARTPHVNQDSFALGHPPLPPPPTPQAPPSTTMGPNPIGPYQSLRMPGLPQAPQGHPSQAMIQASAGPPSQPFL